MLFSKFYSKKQIIKELKRKKEREKEREGKETLRRRQIHVSDQIRVAIDRFEIESIRQDIRLVTSGSKLGLRFSILV